MADSDDAEFRLSFNYPAKKMFFTDKSKAIRIRLDKDAVAFSGLEEKTGSDSLGLFDRVRAGQNAGKDVYVGPGRRSLELLNMFIKLGATPLKPFFILGKFDGEWFQTVQHYDGGDRKAPQKFQPHLRVYFPRSMTTDLNVAPVNDEIARAFGTFAAMVRTALFKITTPRIGRPNYEIREAQAILDLFTRLYDEIMPRSRLPDMEALKDVDAAMRQVMQWARDTAARRHHSGGRPAIFDALSGAVGDHEAQTGNMASSLMDAPRAPIPEPVAAPAPAVAGKPAAPRKPKPAAKPARPVKAAPAAKPVKAKPTKAAKTTAAVVPVPRPAVVAATVTAKPVKSRKVVKAVATAKPKSSRAKVSKPAAKAKTVKAAAPAAKRKGGREKAFVSAQTDLIEALAKTHPVPANPAPHAGASVGTKSVEPKAGQLAPEPEVIDGAKVKRFKEGATGRRLLLRKADPVQAEPVPPPAPPAATVRLPERPASQAVVVTQPPQKAVAVRPVAEALPTHVAEAKSPTVMMEEPFVELSEDYVEIDPRPRVGHPPAGRGMHSGVRRGKPLRGRAPPPPSGKRRTG